MTEKTENLCYAALAILVTSASAGVSLMGLSMFAGFLFAGSVNAFWPDVFFGFGVVFGAPVTLAFCAACKAGASDV